MATTPAACTMRICSPQLAIAPNATSGGEVYDREVLRHLADLGVKIDILLPQGQEVAPHPNWEITRLPLRRGYRWFVSNPFFISYIGRAYRRQPFDLLRVHALRHLGFAALWARKLYRLPVPIVAHHHHIDHDSLTSIVDRRVINAVDLVVTVSHFSRQQLIDELGAPADKVVFVYNGIDGKYKPQPPDEALRQKLGLQGAKVLLHVGGLKPRKNLSQLLVAFREIHSQIPAARLVLVGGGSEEGKLRQLAQELGIPSTVLFAGPVSDAEKLAYISLADLYVTCTLMEGFGLAVGEAMACAVPVVATRAGALPELVEDGENGILTPVNDNAAFIQASIRLLQEHDLAKRMGRSGAARIEQNFRWHRSAEQMLTIYQSVLNRYRASQHHP